MVQNNAEVKYFKTGIFVLIGIGLIIGALLIFGSNKLLQPKAYIETYFAESVQGISEGTQVKYRGLKIGYVEDIAFSSEIYKEQQSSKDRIHNRTIYVKIALISKLFTKLSSEEFNDFMTHEVNSGLRIKLVAQGLTGTSYLELDYVDPKANPIPNLAWQPDNFFVPTVTSALTMLSENAQYIMNELRDIDFKKVFADINTLTNTVNRTVRKTETLLEKIDQPLDDTLHNFQVTSDNLRAVSEQLKFHPAQVFFGSPPPPLDPGKL